MLQIQDGTSNLPFIPHRYTRLAGEEVIKLEGKKEYSMTLNAWLEFVHISFIPFTVLHLLGYIFNLTCYANSPLFPQLSSTFTLKLWLLVGAACL